MTKGRSRPILNRLFIDHPRSVGESYLQHLGQSARFGTRMILGGAACFLHGIVPACFTSTGSRTVKELHDCMVLNRRRQSTDTSKQSDR